MGETATINDLITKLTNNTMAETAGINDLPLEIFALIVIHLNGNTLGSCRRVCKQWKAYIDGSHNVWRVMCQRDFKYASQIAKAKASSECQWYNIYRNLKLWSKLVTFKNSLKEFYKFSLHHTYQILNIDHGILPLRDFKGVELYDLSTLKYLPVALPERDCLKILNNDSVTVIQLKSGLHIQRSIDTPNYATEEFIKADGFVLGPNVLYYHINMDVYKLDLTKQAFTPTFIYKSEFKIKEITLDEGILYLFVEYGLIIIIYKDLSVSDDQVKCPVEWLGLIKHYRAVNNKNFVCYSKNIFKIETEQYEHLYLEFLQSTAVFYYVDLALIATGTGEILLYRLASQVNVNGPIFETLAQLPPGKFAIQLDVCEREKGPIIIASTYFEVYVLQFDFYPHEQESQKIFPPEKHLMLKRLTRLKERLERSESRLKFEKFLLDMYDES